MSASPAPRKTFDKAMSLARKSDIVSLSAAALDMSTDQWHAHLSQIRRALVRNLIAQGASIADDPDGEALLKGKEGDDWDQAVVQFSNHDDAAYLYGLAVGLLLGAGSKEGMR
jgi:hypothetical protein